LAEPPDVVEATADPEALRQGHAKDHNLKQS
jgi:hypothetical protein